MAVTIGDDVVTARVAVVAAAGWSSGLLEPDVAAKLVPPITVTAETVAFFQPTRGPWPSFIQRGDMFAYGLGTPDGLVKAGLHGVRRRSMGRSPVAGSRRREALEEYARKWLPGVEPIALRSTVCLYAASATDDFVLDPTAPSWSASASVVTASSSPRQSVNVSPTWQTKRSAFARPAPSLHRRPRRWDHQPASLLAVTSA